MGVNVSYANGTFQNNLIKMDVYQNTSGKINVTLYTSKPYKDPINVNSKSATEYTILLPETSSSTNTAPSLIQTLGKVKNVHIKTQPYANQLKGYTKITLTSTQPVEIIAISQTLASSKQPIKKITPKTVTSAKKTITTPVKTNIAQNKKTTTASAKSVSQPVQAAKPVVKSAKSITVKVANQAKTTAVTVKIAQTLPAAKTTLPAAKPIVKKVTTVPVQKEAKPTVAKKPAIATKPTKAVVKKPIPVTKTIQQPKPTPTQANQETAVQPQVTPQPQPQEQVQVQVQPQPQSQPVVTPNQPPPQIATQQKPSILTSVKNKLRKIKNKIQVYLTLNQINPITLIAVPLFLILIILGLFSRKLKSKKSKNNQQQTFSEASEQVNNSETEYQMHPEEEQNYQAPPVTDLEEPIIIEEPPINFDIEEDIFKETTKAEMATEVQNELSEEELSDIDEALLDQLEGEEPIIIEEEIQEPEQTYIEPAEETLQEISEELLGPSAIDELNKIMDKEDSDISNQKSAEELFKEDEVPPAEPTMIADLPVLDESDEIITSEFIIDENKSFYLVDYENASTLVGQINNDIVVLRQFSGKIREKLQARVDEQKDHSSNYMVKAGSFRALIEVTDDNMKMLIEL